MMKCVRSGNSLKPVTDDEPLYFLVIRFIERGRDDVIFRTGDKQQGRALFLEADPGDTDNGLRATLRDSGTTMLIYRPPSAL